MEVEPAVAPKADDPFTTANPSNPSVHAVPPSPPPDPTSEMRRTITYGSDGDALGSSHAGGSGLRDGAAAVTSTPGGAAGVAVSTPQPSKISLRLRNTGGGESSGPSRASTPGSGPASRRRKGPQLLASGGLSPSRAESPSVRALDSDAAASPAPGGLDTSAALSIFAPPVSSTLPEALQSVIGTSKSTASTPGPSTANGNGNGNASAAAVNGGGGGRELRVRLSVGGSGPGAAASGSGTDSLAKDAADGLAASSRLRPTRGRDSLQRTGVSASGKGVKVGGGARVANAPPKTAAVSSATRKQVKPSEPQPNQDFCSACRGIGRFLCCDGCPRSFHFMCLEPPLRIDELPEEDNWYCKKCKSERKPPKRSPPPSADKELKPIPMVFKQLIKTMDKENPEQFRLPEQVRTFFTGVGTGAMGEYLDAEESRTKYDRKGFQEERDSHRLRDAKSRVVACYACGGSSIPLRSLTTDPGSSWRPIVSCDYCSLSWHLDCLNPPMASMPNSGRKWMCPNHAEQVMRKRRTVREKMETVDVDSEGMSNNGNITVVPDETTRPAMQYEDLIINRKKFRIPEKIIKLDFWSKLGYGNKKRKRAESEESDLTSLASTGSADDEATPSPKPVLPPRPVYRTATREDLEAANLVLMLTTNGSPTNLPAQPPLHTDYVSPRANVAPPVVAGPVNNLAGHANATASTSNGNGNGPGARASRRQSNRIVMVDGDTSNPTGTEVSSATATATGRQPVNLAAMDVDEPPAAASAPAPPAAHADGEAPRRITLKFKNTAVPHPAP